MEFIFKAVIAGCVVALASTLSGRIPIMAGFLVALPISTAILLPMSYAEHGSFQQVTVLAKSIAVAVPLTLFFFVPFFFAERLGLNFWLTYLLAFGCLLVGFFLHRIIVNWLISPSVS
ncbi:MAG: hypothetical protein VX252_08575 [Myxococcota bacterium]|nr:hypothetical protein [Myxococcota bacterium]